MKKLLAVEQTRRDYYADAQRNTIHRSSLLVPVLPNSEVSISFLNHFLIKRKNPNVGCRITAIGELGKRIVSRLIPIDEPRVYTIRLQGEFCPAASSFVVEFFSSSNLFIPFPAVMINHRCKDSYSTVHSFNRVLNDVFEDDEINAVQVQESGIDVALAKDVSTFFVLAAGNQDLRGNATVQFISPDISLHHSVDIQVPRLSQQLFVLDDIVPNWPKSRGTVLIEQPRQQQFYGRMFVGQISRSGAFVGNHSYYDNSHVEGEYWDDATTSMRTYPFLPGIDSIVRIYPTQSPSSISFSIRFNSSDGINIGSTKDFILVSPGTDFLDLNIRQLWRECPSTVVDATSFSVIAQPTNGNTPTRLNHQLVYTTSGIEASINISLQNFHVIHSADKPRTTWGQLIHSSSYESWLAIANDGHDDPASTVAIKFFSDKGLITAISFTIPRDSAKHINLADILPSDDKIFDDEFVWYEFESSNYFLSAYSVSRHLVSGNCTGEHSF
ncbi:MAG: hypothetical protein AAB088_04585 [Actinomycetota bacterium]|mgnify:FL=1